MKNVILCSLLIFLFTSCLDHLLEPKEIELSDKKRIEENMISKEDDHSQKNIYTSKTSNLDEKGKNYNNLGTVNSDFSSSEYLYITVNDLRLRSSPNLGGRVVDGIPINTRVEYLNEKSNNRTEVVIEGSVVNDFWYKIQTPNGKTGWIHGCCFSDVFETKH